MTYCEVFNKSKFFVTVNIQAINETDLACFPLEGWEYF